MTSTNERIRANYFSDFFAEIVPENKCQKQNTMRFMSVEVENISSIDSLK
jgi:hypothetical protein